MLRVERPHLIFALQVLQVGVPDPARVRDALPMGAAEEGVLRDGVVLSDEMHVVGDDDLYPEFPAEAEDAVSGCDLLRDESVV